MSGKKINYGTKNLIVINYPPAAGGKFLSLCLALSEKVLHQDQFLARNKILGKIDSHKSFKIGLAVIERSFAKGKHFELGCRELAGFHFSDDPDKQQSLASDLWIDLTNQKKFYSCMMSHSEKDFIPYPNARHIVLKNYEWVLKARNIKIKNNFDGKIHDQNKTFYFDQSSLKDGGEFEKEMSKLFDFLGLESPVSIMTETLRESWLKTFTIGYPKEQ